MASTVYVNNFQMIGCQDDRASNVSLIPCSARYYPSAVFSGLSCGKDCL